MTLFFYCRPWHNLTQLERLSRCMTQAWCCKPCLLPWQLSLDWQFTHFSRKEIFHLWDSGKYNNFFSSKFLLINFFFFSLFAGLTSLLVGGIVQIFVQSTALELLIGIGGAMLFALFIIYDTHMLMHVLSPEEYILAAINIYLDIINLFLHILRALAAARQ